MVRSPRRLALWLFALLLLPVTVCGQAYTRIVVFGDSLSDTGNVARLAQNKYGARLPGPLFGYTDGRFTDGTDTLPAASLYTGVWIEQLAASLAAKPAIKASLDGGTDYAYGDATTATGTTTTSYGSTGFSLAVNNMGQQVTDFLATRPAINSGTLFVVWGGANDLLNATSQADIVAAATNEIAVLQRLRAAGATEILVLNLPPLGLTPRLNGNALAAAQANAAAQGFNAALFAGMQQLVAASPGSDAHFYPLDVYTLLQGIVNAPATYKLDNVTAKSQFASANPDRYLFWDDIHPTTAGHALLAAAALKLMTPVVVTTATTLSSSALSSNLNGSITLTATVTAASGVPTGTVTFLDGTNTIGTGTLAASGTAAATATLQIATLSAGTHSLTAQYGGTATFAASTSAAISQVVTAPAAGTTASPTSLTITRGSTGTTTLTTTPVGGFSGSVTYSCGTLPRNMTCAFSPATLTLSGDNKAQTSTLTIGTQTMSALTRPVLRRRQVGEAVAACVLFLLTGLARKRGGTRSARLLSLLVLGFLFGAAGLTGCGGNDNRVSTGTYTVPVNVTSGSSTSSINLQVTVQ